jgi:cystathionine beta-lyase
MIKKAGVALDDGDWFGTEGKGFMRINIACPHSFLEEGLKRIETAVNSL